MKGFIVKSTTWGNQTHKVGLPEGCTISFEFSRWWGAIWCPSGYTNESENWSWHGGDIHVGDEVEIDFDSGMIYDHTKGTQYKGQAFPEFMQKIIKAEGLINYINENTK